MDKLLDEMAEAMHNLNATNGKRNIPRSSYSRDYQAYVLKQAEAAKQVIEKHFILTSKP